MARGKYKQKRLNKLRRKTNLSSLNLPLRITALLEAAGIKTLYDLNVLVERYDITRLPKLGKEEEGIVRSTFETFECKDKK